MNKRRRWICKWCALISAAMILFPPVMRNDVSYGYGFLFNMAYIDGLAFINLHVNVVILALQIIMVALVGGAFYVAKPPSQVEE